MSTIFVNMISAYIISFLGTMIYRSHMMSSVLCLEEMMLSVFILSTLMMLNFHYISLMTIPTILLVFAACEAAIGLALLVMISNTYGIDYVQNLNLLQC